MSLKIIHADHIPRMLKRARARLKKSQAELAAEYDLSQRAIWQWENRTEYKKSARKDILAKLIVAYRLTPEEQKNLLEPFGVSEVDLDIPSESAQKIGRESAPIVVVPTLFYQIIHLSKEDRDDLMGMVSVWIQTHCGK